MTMVADRGLAAARHVLPNGAVIISKEAHTVGAVTIQVSLRAGSIYDLNELLGLSHLASRVYHRGTHTLDSEAIAEALDSRGVSLSVSANRHVLTVSCTSLSEDFEEMLTLVGGIVMGPVFPEEEIEKRKREVLSSIRQDEDSPAATAMHGLFGVIVSARSPLRSAGERECRHGAPHDPARPRRVPQGAILTCHPDSHHRGRRRARPGYGGGCAVFAAADAGARRGDSKRLNRTSK